MFERRLYYHIDWALLAAILALCAIGVAMIFSTTADPTRGVSHLYVTQIYAIVLGLAACDVFEASDQSGMGSGEMAGWRAVSGKAPSRAEYAAMVAACQGGAVQRAAASSSLGALEACLADLGLKRAP